MLINFARSLPDYLHILISIIPSLLFFKYTAYLQPYIGLNPKEAFQNKTEQKKTKQTSKKHLACVVRMTNSNERFSYTARWRHCDAVGLKLPHQMFLSPRRLNLSLPFDDGGFVFHETRKEFRTSEPGNLFLAHLLPAWHSSLCHNHLRYWRNLLGFPLADL